MGVIARGCVLILSLVPLPLLPLFSLLFCLFLFRPLEVLFISKNQIHASTCVIPELIIKNKSMTVAHTTVVIGHQQPFKTKKKRKKKCCKCFICITCNML